MPGRNIDFCCEFVGQLCNSTSSLRAGDKIGRRQRTCHSARALETVPRTT